MALRLNLYHEIESQARERQRDPLKLGLYGLGGIILLCLLFYFIRWQAVNSVVKQRIATERQWQELDAKATEARKRTEEMRETLRVAGVLKEATDQRFFWGPQLQRFFEAVPADVQINGLVASVNLEGPSDAPRPFTFVIDGEAAGKVPRIAAEEFRQQIVKQFTSKSGTATAAFRRLDEPEEPALVLLNGTSVGKASFTIGLEVGTPVSTGATK